MTRNAYDYSFFRDGFAPPVAQALLTLLNQEVANIGFNLERMTQLTFNFRSPTYSPEQGGSPGRDPLDTRP